MVYKLYNIQQLTKMQWICEIENEKVRQRTQRANDLQERKLKKASLSTKKKIEMPRRNCIQINK